MARFKILVPAFLVVLLASCAAPGPNPAAVRNLSDMPDEAAARALGIGDAAWGYHVIDADSGAVLAQRLADTRFPPASTAKLPTMIAALGILGPSYRFSTQLRARGHLESGVLTGDLALVGNGDPLFVAGDLRALAARLREVGVTRLQGRFLYQSTLPQFPEVEPEQPADAPYNQGVSGLNLEFNRAALSRVHGGEDDPFFATPAEATDLVPRPRRSDVIRTDVPVRDPALLTARMFKRFAEAEGTSLPDPAPGAAPEGSAVVAEIKSQPLIEIARAGLEYSNNMVAEVVGLAAARARGARTDSLAQSAVNIGVWLERQVPELSGFAARQANHSGLSTLTRVTPAQMTAILRYAYGRRFEGWRIDTLLPPGGGREGYRGRFKAPETAFRVWAKSGTMRYIKGLIGYLDARSGRRLIFALYVFDAAKRENLENDPERFGQESRRASNLWRASTDEFEEALITKWISSY